MPADVFPNAPADPRGGGLFRVTGNLSMATSTALRSIGNDPLTFAIQLARRFPAARVPMLALARALRGADRQLAQTWLSGDLVATRASLDEIAAQGSLSRIAAEIAQASGRPELIVDDAEVHPIARARAAWQLGEPTHAIALLERCGRGARLNRNLRAELALMTPGNRLRWSHPESSRIAGIESGVLHLLTNSLPHTQSGYTVRSHAVLSAQRDAGISAIAMTRIGYPVVVGKLGAAAVDVIDGVAYHRALPIGLARAPDGRLAQQADELTALARRVGPAALQTTTPYTNALVVREVANFLSLPWAYEVRGMLEQTWVASLASEEARGRAMASERFRLMREREAELASAADAVFTLSGSMRDDLAERGVPPDHIRLVPNGIDPELLDRTPPSPADARAALGMPPNGFWVGATSSLVDYEGFDVLVDAVRIARADGHDVRLLLVGDGHARQALEAQAAAAGLDDAAVFAGRVRRDAVGRYREALDLLVVPRLDRAVTRTVSPLKPIEAMASGRPLLVSALPPLLETIGKELEASGAAVPPGNAPALARRIVELASSPSDRERLAALGRIRAGSRTWPTLGETYRQTFLAVGADLPKRS